MVKNMNYKKLLFITTFTICSIAINYCCSYLAGLIAFPLYLDSIMTIAVTALCGLVPGLICAFCSNFLLSIFANTGILFSICHISTAVVAHLVFNAEKKEKYCLWKYPFFIHYRKFYVDRIFCRIYKFYFGRFNFLLFLFSKHNNSTSRQRSTRNLCCNKKSFFCSLFWRNRYKHNR